MNARDRFRKMVAGDEVDRPYLMPEGAWAKALRRWKSEGMTDESLLEGDGLATCAMQDFTPPFEERVIADEGDKVVLWSSAGMLVRTWKAGGDQDPGVQYLEFPVKDRASWLAVKQRLDPDHPDHLGPDWLARVRSLRECGKPIRLDAGHSISIFGFTRDLVGDAIYTWFYDCPDLVHEIMDFLAWRVVRFIERVTADLRIDLLQIWEDMAYKGAPLIGPKMFRKFMLEPTRRIVAAARKHDIPCISVDSDGDISLLIPLWLEAGVMALSPFEVAAGMDVNRVREQFGPDLFLFGGFDKRALARGREVIDAEFERLRPAIDMGRYFLCVDHSIPPDVAWNDFVHYAERKRAILCG